MKIGIVGAGSLGLLWATRLKSPDSVTLYCHTENQAKEIEQSGITLTDLAGWRKTYHITAEWIDAPHSAPCDVLFLMVKQPSLDEVIQRLPSLMHPKTYVVAWQNGLGHVEKLKRLGHDYLYSVVTTEGAYRLSDTAVRHTGTGYTKLGQLFLKGIDPLFCAFLKRNGIEEVSDILLEMWQKFSINCVINPLTAILEVSNGELLNPQTKEIMDDLIRELCDVATKKSIPLVFAETKQKVLEVCQKTAMNRSSMLQDIMNKRRTEIASLNQMVVEYAKEVGISAPYHRLILQLVHAKSVLQGA